MHSGLFGRTYLTLALAAIGGLMPLRVALAQAEAEILTNEAVMQMVTGKLSKDLIIGKIGATRPGFDLSSEGIITLCTNKVDQKIVQVMLDAGQSSVRRGNAAQSLSGLDEVLTNDVIVRMVSTKVPKQLILSKIQVSRSAFDISATGLVGLNTNKVPEDVIKAMMLPPPPAATKAVAPTREAPVPVAAPPAKPPLTKPPVTKPPVKKPPTAFV